MRNQVRKIIECSNKYSAARTTHVSERYLAKDNGKQKNANSPLERTSNESSNNEVAKKKQSQLSNLKLLIQWQQRSQSKPHLYRQNEQQPIFISIKHLNVSQKLSFKKYSYSFKKKGQIFPLRAKTFRKDSQTNYENVEKAQLYTSREQKNCLAPLIHNFLTNISKVDTSAWENQEFTKLNEDGSSQSIKIVGQLNKPLTLRQQRIKRKNMMTKNKQKLSIKTEESFQMKVQSQRPFMRQKAISLLGISKKISVHSCQNSARKSAVGLIVLGKKSSKGQPLSNG